MANEEIFKRSVDVVCRHVAGETILVPIRGNVADMQRLYALDEVGAFVWDCLESGVSIATIAERVAAEFDVDATLAADDLKDFLADMREHELVQVQD